MSNQIIEENKEEKLDEYEQSAAMFHHLSQVFRKQVYELAKRKKRAPIRVLEAFLFRPLEDVELNGKEEKNLLDLCSTIIYHKVKIMEYVQIEKQKNNNIEGENNDKK